METRFTNRATIVVLSLALLVTWLPQPALGFQPDPAPVAEAAPTPELGDGSFTAIVPAPGTKNGPRPGQPGRQADSSTNATAGMPNQSREPASPTALLQSIAADGVLSCGATSTGTWTTTSDAFEVVLQCSLTLPSNGYVYLSADGGLGLQDAAYEAQFTFDINSTVGDDDASRWVNVYGDGGNGTDKSFALSILKALPAGTYTFYLLGLRYWESGTVLVYDPTLSAVFIPAAAAEVRTCSMSGLLNWLSTSSTLVPVRQCSLTAPSAGVAFVSADTSVALQEGTGEYLARLALGLDSNSTAAAGTDRRVNIHADAGDGTDENARVSAVLPVSAGTHTFYSLAARESGVGTVLLYNPTLSVIYVPTPSTELHTCGDSGDLAWTTTATTFGIIRECTLMSSGAGWALLSADGGLAPVDGEYEAEFAIGLNDATDSLNVNRRINIYTGAGTGTHRVMALSALLPLTQGANTFYLLGRRSGGNGTVEVTDPTLSVVAKLLTKTTYLPLILR